MCCKSLYFVEGWLINMNKKRKTIDQSAKNLRREKLYSALLCIYQFSQLKDFLFLKSEYFLKLCEVAYIDWKFNKDLIDEDFFKSTNERSWPFRYSCPLVCKTNDYGELIFFSSHKFSQSRKIFLKKIVFFVSSALYFVKNREKMENIKQHWGGAFDSFSQAFCITDKNFKIIRSNKSFQAISNKTKTELFAKNLFELFPIPDKIIKSNEQTGSWLIKEEKEGEENCWEISLKPLFLKKEKMQVLLFLIKNVSKEIEIENKLSVQAKERELGFIKGSIAHELNNPIAGIKALLDIMEQQMPSDKLFIRDSLKEMQMAINRCEDIVKNLLAVSYYKEDKTSLSLSQKEPL